MTKKLKRYMLSMNFFLIWIMFLEVSNAIKEVVKLQSNTISTEKSIIDINNNEIQQVIETSSSTTTISSTPLGPYFVERVNENISISALVDKTAYLSCKVNNLGNKTVSWVRHRDVHLLTVGRYTYTSDDRFRAINGLNSNEWILQIKYPQQRDAGIYECQISTTPHLSRFYQLNVIEPKARILGGSEMYIDHGSTINITCLIIGGLDLQGFVFWFHNNRIINENSLRGGIQITTELGSKAKSVLLINNARPTDSGRYDCKPTNSDYKSIVIHVLKGNYPEAMQHNNSGAQFSSRKIFNYYVIDIIFIFVIIKFLIIS